MDEAGSVEGEACGRQDQVLGKNFADHRRAERIEGPERLHLKVLEK